MSRQKRSDNLASKILQDVESGNLEDAADTLRVINEQAHLPHVCNLDLLAALDKARSLVIVQRSHLLSQLRSLEARRRYGQPIVSASPTWQIDG